MAQNSILLEYKLSVGNVLKYKSVAETKQTTTQAGKTKEQQSTMEMNIRQHVIDFMNDIYRLEIFIESGSITQNNITKKMPAIEKPTYAKFKKNGEAVSEQAQSQASQQSFPDYAIEEGESWSSQTRLNFPGRPDPILINYDYTFEEIETLKGFECARIKVECPPSSITLQPGITQDIHITGNVYFAYKEGVLIKSSVKTKSSLISPQIKMDAENSTNMELMELNGEKLD